jgi:hypothetical protein
MSDPIPLPSTNSVDLEVLRPFREDYLQLQNVEEKTVLLAMHEHLFRNTKVLQTAFAAIGLQNRHVMPLDDQMIVLSEWAIHDVMLDGQTILMRVAANPPKVSDKALRALPNRLQARYSVYRLNNLVPELGVEFEDMVFGGKFAVLDLPTAENRKPGDLMATRIFWTGEYWTHSSGRFFPRPELVPVVCQRVRGLVGESSYQDLSAAIRSQVTTAIIRTCAEDLPDQDLRDLDWGVLNKYKKQTPFGSTRPQHPPAGGRDIVSRMNAFDDRLRFTGNQPPGGPDDQVPPANPSGKTRVGRNDRCPCGSGKKYKHCCGID